MPKKSYKNLVMTHVYYSPSTFAQLFLLPYPSEWKQESLKFFAKKHILMHVCFIHVLVSLYMFINYTHTADASNISLECHMSQSLFIFSDYTHSSGGLICSYIFKYHLLVNNKSSLKNRNILTFHNVSPWLKYMFFHRKILLI